MDWNEIFNYIDRHENGCSFIFYPLSDGSTILHQASNIENKEDATKNVRRLLYYARESNVSVNRILSFVNTLDKDNNTALHIAAKNQNIDLVELLLEYGADVNLPEEGSANEALALIFNRVHRALTSLYDKSIYLDKTHEGISQNDLAWEVVCDFGAITGVSAPESNEKDDPHQNQNMSDQRKWEHVVKGGKDPTFSQNDRDDDHVDNNAAQGRSALSNGIESQHNPTIEKNPEVEFHPLHDYDDNGKIFRQTKMLAFVLRQQQQIVTSEVLLHPLVQVFFYFKLKKFRWLIYLSVFLHIFWHVLCIRFFRAVYVRYNTNSTESNSTTSNGNKSRFDRNFSLLGLETEEYIFLAVFGIALLTSIIKELFEAHICPDKRFYATQWENLWQWLVILLIPSLLAVVLACGVGSPQVLYISIVGIFVACILIQTQLTKIQWFGMYTEMLAKGLVNLVKFLIVFMPILASFAITLNLLMVDDPQFAFDELPVKVLSMMVGEINYRDVFHNECDSDTCVVVPHPSLTKVLFGLFVICVVLMLQNILIGLTVSDIRSLKKKAMEQYVASQLELIYIMEAFLMSKYMSKIMGRFSCWKRFRDGLLVTEEDIKADNGTRFMSLGEYPPEMWNVLRQIRHTSNDN